jgi:hypothetical protein
METSFNEERLSENNNNNNGNSTTVHGVLRHTTVRIPFKVYIPVEEAQEKDICIIISSPAINKLDLASITPIYLEACDGEEVTSIMIGDKEQQFIKGIISKNIIKITLNANINHKKS